MTQHETTLTHILYETCPRGVRGGREAHERQHLVHTIIHGRRVCAAREVLT